jgi:Na+/H+-dicarboxylate symporter
MNLKKMGLLPRLLLGIIGGIIIGSAGPFLNVQDTLVFQGIVRLFVTFTSLFSTFLSFLIPLLIISFVAVGMAELGKKANKLFGITLFLAYASTLLAGFGAFFLGSAFLPSLISEISGTVDAGMKFEPFFTIEVAPICGVMTALVLSFVLGIGMANLKNQSLLNSFRDLQAVIAKTLTKVVIPLIPVHIAGLFCKIAANGELVATAAIFLSLFVMILLFQYGYILFQFGMASLISGKNQYKKIGNILPAYFTAVGTQSSASTIPVSLNCARKNGVRDDIADFCIPLCATIHLAGDTICLVLGSMGIMLAAGIEPTLALFAPFIVMLGVTMVAAPGVPGGGVMAALGLITSMLGFTEPMQQLIISLHFSQDSFGTATNISGDQALALIVNKMDEGNAENENLRAAYER